MILLVRGKKEDDEEIVDEEKHQRKKMKVCLLLLALVVGTYAIGFQFPSTPEEMKTWLCGAGAPCPDGSDIPKIRLAFIQKLNSIATSALKSKDGMRDAFRSFFDESYFADPIFLQMVESVVAKHETYDAEAFRAKVGTNYTPPGNNPYPFFNWIPFYVASSITNRAGVTFSSSCFQDNTVTTTLSADQKSLSINFNTRNGSSFLCSDLYMIGSVQNIQLQMFYTAGDHTINIDLSNATVAQIWDIQNKGIRIFRFNDDMIQLIYDLLNTVTMFLGPLTNATVSDDAAQANLYFVNNYAKISPPMVARNDSVVVVPEDYIQSGDFVGIIRLDGLDPMLGWAMGSTTGHTVVALRAPNNTLFLCESTTSDSYWPTNGIQCHDYNTWIQLAVNADHNTVVIPLSPTYRAKFNATKAWAWFETTRGLDYGYHTLLFGWIDTIKDNYPCLPPNYENCLAWEHFEVLFGYLDTVIPALGDVLFNQAWNFRLGTKNLLAAELFMYAGQHNIQANTISTIVEQDSWLYNTTRDGVPTVGQSQVCCVFVCNIWKHAGIFGDIADQIQCGEQTNWDDYSLNLFDTSRMGTNRPDSCKAQDPNNALCQLTGKYTLNLNDLNTRQPYPHQDETCPSLAPSYTRPANC